MALLKISGYAQLVAQRKAWIDQALAAGMGQDGKDPRWSGGIAVGSFAFVESVQHGLGYGARGRTIVEYDGSCVLREAEAGYAVILP